MILESAKELERKEHLSWVLFLLPRRTSLEVR
jgi:hypothetical protein